MLSAAWQFVGLLLAGHHRNDADQDRAAAGARPALGRGARATWDLLGVAQEVCYLRPSFST
jgi:hypothetical protein